MTVPLNLDATATHIKRAGVAQNKLATLTVSEARRKVKPHIKAVQKNITNQLRIRDRDRKAGVKGSEATYYKLKEIEHVIETEWPTITKSVRKTAATNVPVGAKSGFNVVNSELGTAYRTPLVAASFAESVDLIVKTAAKVHTKVIRDEIVQGMIANDDFATSAARVAQFFDKGKGCGHYKNPFANATRVIRSETQLAHVRSKVALYENEGYTRVLIVNGKVGCPICAPHIGEIYRLAEDPLPIYHPHCGCSAVAYDRKPVPPENQIPESKPIPVERESEFQKPEKQVKSLEVDSSGKSRKRIINDFEKKWTTAGALKNNDVKNIVAKFDSPPELLDPKKTAYFSPVKGGISMDGSNKVERVRDKMTYIHEYGHYIDNRIGKPLGVDHVSSARGSKALKAFADDEKSINKKVRDWYKKTGETGTSKGWDNARNRSNRRFDLLRKEIREAGLDTSAENFKKSIETLNKTAQKELLSNKGIYGKMARSSQIKLYPESSVELWIASKSGDISFIVDRISGVGGEAGGFLSDLVGSLTKTKVGYGHSKKYLKVSGKAQTEVFANNLVLTNEGGIWEELRKDLSPEFSKEFDSIIKETIKK